MRTVHFRIWNSNLFAIGSARGFFCVKDLQTMYYKLQKDKKGKDEVNFNTFNSKKIANKKGFVKLFDEVVTNLDDVLKIIKV